MKNKYYKKFIIHITEKPKPFSDRTVVIGILIIICLFSNGIALTSYNKLAESSTISIENPSRDWDARISPERVEDSISTGKENIGVVVEEGVEALIEKVFHEEPKIALAVAKGESGLKVDAKGWNCRYGKKSTSCKVADRGKAWSVDCGLYQINVIAKECPEHLLNPDENIQVARKMYEARKWSPWVAFNNKQYLNHIQ